VRRHLIDLASTTVVHLGPGLSVVDILVAAYATLNLQPAPDGRPTDRIILSKGHAAAALYFVLHEMGILAGPVGLIGRKGDTRAGHPSEAVAGVEAPTGALGHGLAIGAGMAAASRLGYRPQRVLVVVGDGELDEGSVWEAALFAAHHRLSDLHVVVDRNGMQQSGSTEQVLDLEPLAQKWREFGWRVGSVDGHDPAGLVRAINAAAAYRGGPSVTIARTVKGKGVDFMEGDLRWHQAWLDPRTYQLARAALRDAGSGPSRKRAGTGTAPVGKRPELGKSP
jgi:transketolase